MIENASLSPSVSTDADLIRDQLRRLGLSQREAGRRLGIDDRAMRYYCAGKAPVPPVVFLALRQLEQISVNEKVLALLADETLRTSDGEQTAERLTKANAARRAAIELLRRSLPPPPRETCGRPNGSNTPNREAQPAHVEQHLFKPEWSALESDDLRVLLENRLGGPGQSDGHPDDHRYYLPRGGVDCRVAIRFTGTTITAFEPGPAFDAQQWSKISAAVDVLCSSRPDKIGRDVAFSAFRVKGWWRGERSGVQILPPPSDAPTVRTEMGQHPFVLETPIHSDAEWFVENARRRREQRRLTLLLNVLLNGRVNCETRQVEQAWACLGVQPDGNLRSEWLQLSYITHIGQVVAEALSEPAGEAMQMLRAEDYYARLGHDGSALCVPDDLDESICLYRDLPLPYRARFERALFWLDQASRQWAASVSASFGSLVSAVEALTERGSVHKVHRPECGDIRTHEVPGATARFRAFFETYAPGASHKRRREEMYSLRSGISHGSKLIAFDEGRAWGWGPPWSNQAELHSELWILTRVAMRNYLRNPGGASAAG
jgi:hypothetical protein